MPPTDEFRLQALLNFKLNLVDTLEVEFAQLRVAHARETEQLQYLQRRKTEEIEFLSQAQKNGRLNCEAIQRRQQYLDTLADGVAQQADRVLEAKRCLECKREELVGMLQDQKVLEKLRDQHQTKQRQVLRQREANMVDELVITRYARER